MPERVTPRPARAPMHVGHRPLFASPLANFALGLLIGAILVLLMWQLS